MPSIGDSAAGSTVITKKCSQPSVCSKPAWPSAPIGSSGGALEAEVGLRVGVVEVVGHLAALEQHVERHDGRAGLEDAVVDDREVRQVRAAQRHLVARLDAARDQQVGDLVGGAVDLGVGQPRVAEHDRRRGRGGPAAESSSSEERFDMRPTYSAVVTRRHPSSRRAARGSVRPCAGRRRSPPSASSPAATAGTRPGAASARPSPSACTRQPPVTSVKCSASVRADPAPGPALGPDAERRELGDLHVGAYADRRWSRARPGRGAAPRPAGTVDRAAGTTATRVGCAGRRGSGRPPPAGTGSSTRGGDRPGGQNDSPVSSSYAST